MTTTVQVNGNQIFINGMTLQDIIKSAVKEGAQMVMEGKIEDPLETVRVADLAKDFGCCQKTMEKQIKEAGIKINRVGKFNVIFKKDKRKLFQP